MYVSMMFWSRFYSSVSLLFHSDRLLFNVAKLIQLLKMFKEKLGNDPQQHPIVKCVLCVLVFCFLLTTGNLYSRQLEHLLSARQGAG